MVCVCVCMYVSMHVCMCVCVCVYVCVYAGADPGIYYGGGGGQVGSGVTIKVVGGQEHN